MSDYRRPVDELPVKNASQLSLADTLIGVDAVAEPAAFQAQLGEIAARLVGPIADDIIGPGGALPVEVGTFTPVLIADQSNPTVTYGSQDGDYYRIGNLVWFVLFIQTTAYSGGAGTLRIDGLPYPGIAANPPLACRPQGVDWGGGAVPYAFVRSGLTQIGFGFLRDSASPVFPTAASWPNAGSIGISGTYRCQP